MSWAAKLTHTPPAFHLAAILPCVAFEACRRNYYVEQSPLHIWTAVIAPPAIGKSTAVAYVQDFNRDFYRRIFRADMRVWCSLEGSLPGVVEALAQMRDDAYDITPGVLYHSELSRVLRAEDAAELLCLLYDCRDIERNLRYLQKRADKGDDVKTTIIAPRVSAIVTSTRSAMQSVFKQHMLFGGLASRLTWCYVPQVEADKLMYKELRDDKGRARALDAWAAWVGVLDSFSAYGASRMVTIGSEAEELFEKFYDEMLRPIIADPENELASIAQRASGTVVRIAALYAMSVGQLGIDEDCAQRAINFIKRSLKQSEILMPQLSESQFGRASAQLLDAVLQAGKKGLPRKEQFHVLKGQPKAFVDQVRETLIEAGLVVEMVMPTSTKGGRPAQLLFGVGNAPAPTPQRIGAMSH